MIDTNVPASRPSIGPILSRFCREVIGYFQQELKTVRSARDLDERSGRPELAAPAAFQISGADFRTLQQFGAGSGERDQAVDQDIGAVREF